MKHFIFTTLLLSVFLTAFAGPEDKTVSIGTIHHLHSAILNEDRELWIYIPESLKKEAHTSVRYPVVYLLDGDAYFHSVSGIISELSEVNSNAFIPDMILVAVTNTDRVRDFTPTRVSDHPTSGGLEQFTKFFEKELFPYIDSVYPTAPNRALVGHSMGGLVVLNTLFHHRSLFDTYFLLDPSTWWDDKKLFNQADSVLNHTTFSRKTLYVASSSICDAGDTAQLGAFSRKCAQNGIRTVYKHYPDDYHSSLVFPAVYDGLRFAFNFYKRPPFVKLMEPHFNADSILKTHYNNVSKMMGYRVAPLEGVVDMVATRYKMDKKYDQALYFYKMNLENFPNSFNANCNIADCYETMGDKAKAISYYSKALKIKDNPDLRKYLEGLKAEKGK